MVRLTVYSREFEIEAVIASASGTPYELDMSTVRPDLIREIIRAYQEILPNYSGMRRVGRLLRTC